MSKTSELRHMLNYHRYQYVMAKINTSMAPRAARKQHRQRQKPKQTPCEYPPAFLIKNASTEPCQYFDDDMTIKILVDYLKQQQRANERLIGMLEYRIRHSPHNKYSKRNISPIEVDASHCE